MKLVLRITALVSIAFFMVFCGDGGSTGATNKYIGEAPGIAQSYTVKIDELETEQDEATDFETLAKLDKEIKQADKEAEAKVEELEATLSLPIKVPFTGEVDNEEYKLDDLKITGVRYNDIELTAEITPKVTRSHIFGYIQALDSDGNPLLSEKDWAVLAVSNWRQVKEGEPAIMKGYFRGLEKLETLEKFSFHPRSEYEKYK